MPMRRREMSMLFSTTWRVMGPGRGTHLVKAWMPATASPPRAEANRRRKLDDRGEAHLIALACSPPPAGHDHWTLRLLAALTDLDKGVTGTVWQWERSSDGNTDWAGIGTSSPSSLSFASSTSIRHPVIPNRSPASKEWPHWAAMNLPTICRSFSGQGRMNAAKR